MAILPDAPFSGPIGTGFGPRVSADIAVITPARYVLELAKTLGEAL
jgi:hypothetical protein